MILETLRIGFDFGLLVLIWMVQLVIYPSFTYFSRNDLIRWHRIYVQRISYIVIPLMLGQTLLAIYQLYLTSSLYTAGSVVLILFVWMLTFLLFVPRHNAVSNVRFDENTLSELVSYNWSRTALWSIIFIWTLFTHV
ncbi:hypothetical protein [Maribacter antarcticus]|uniref:hypothetical protein n=1 Tax=Maribacter antarcticus TaxID=505250 RepID=UPI0009FE15BC|nr:hypothetical protein [Maribacter antarcticus]